MKFILEEKIPELLAELAAGGGEVWAPQVIQDTVNTVLFAPWREGADLSLDMNTSVSAKELVLPATEKLFSFRYDRTSAGERIEIGSGEESDSGADAIAPVILFGSRACDAAAFVALDALLLDVSGEAYQDPGYCRRRESLTVITLACTTADAACFCSSFGEGPANKAGSDVFLYPLEGGFLAEPLTDKGKQVTGLRVFEDSCATAPPLAETARVELVGLAEKLAAAFADMELWGRVTERCLSCGYCTYSCPTCHCFNIFDEMRGDRAGERLRSWDACMFHQYTREASGHNPRPRTAHRYRNRLGHKFWYYPENQGAWLCTGCGRCIRGCPGNLDIREAIMAVQEWSGSRAGTVADTGDGDR